MAILSSHLRFATERFWLKPGIAGRILGTVLLVGAGAYFSLQISRIGQQTYVLSKFPTVTSFDERLALLKRAHQIDPQNGSVILWIGELLRKTGWEAEDGADELVRGSIPWFERGIALNRWNPYNYLNLGMSYHWLKEHDKAAPFFAKALEIDPNGSFAVAMNGWHKLQLGDLHGARDEFWRSILLFHHTGVNEFAKSYHKIVERRIAEQAVTP
jgi:tetratricopeptide (TPR) repeat protein